MSDSIPSDERTVACDEYGIAYLVVPDGDADCKHCGTGQHWTVAWMEGGEATQLGTSWNDREMADEVARYMNQAFNAGRHSSE